MHRERVREAARSVRAVVRAHPELLTALLCAVVISTGMRGPDLPAQEFRTWVWRTYGAVLWNDQWYGGHTLPGYSLLFPPLAAVFGTRAVGVLACVGSTVAMRRLVRQAERRGHDAALLWFAVVTVVDLVVGRVPFALGFALGIGALAAARERRPVLAAVAALLCGAASPLAAAFLLLVGAAWLPSVGWRVALPLAPAAVALVVASVFGDGGRFPFPLITLLTVLTFVGLGLRLAPRRSVVLRRGLALYGASAVVLFVVPNPVGGNVVRLGAIVAGPLAAFELVRAGRRRALTVLAVPLLLWQLSPVPSVAAGTADPSGRAAYYSRLVAYLDAHRLPLGRVEVPMTRGRWESDFLATSLPLARGWERQVDLAHNAALYDNLTADSYRQWLLADGVRWVALPDVPLDGSAAPEAALLAHPPPYLVEVWHDAHWRLWRVRGAAPLVSGDAHATLVDLGISSFRLHAPRAGESVVRVHWTRFWSVASGDACVWPTSDGWTVVYSASPGDVLVTAQLGFANLVTRGSDCSSPGTPGR